MFRKFISWLFDTWEPPPEPTIEELRIQARALGIPNVDGRWGRKKLQDKIAMRLDDGMVSDGR